MATTPQPKVYDIGDRPTLRANFTTTAGTPVNPSSVTIVVRDPSGNEDSYTGGQLTNDVTGQFDVAIDLDEAGVWTWRAEGSASPKTAGEREMIVRRSAIRP